MQKIDFYDISKYTTAARAIKDNIVLHWSGCGDYNSVFSDYHVNITGDGSIYMDGSLADIRFHAWNRNTGAIGISISCMDGAVIGKDGRYITRGLYPFKEIQLETMAKVAAKIAEEVGIETNNIKTHAEIADIDGYGINSDDPQMRWDLIHYGDDLRARVKIYRDKWAAERKKALKAQKTV